MSRLASLLTALCLAGCGSASPETVALPVLSEQATWTSPFDSWSQGPAWGDWDGDGDLDLAQCNSVEEPNRVFDNADGELLVAWTSAELEDSLSCAWGDWDGDGDLDLAVGNCNYQHNRVYENTGSEDPAERLVPVWLSDEQYPTPRVAWADWDGDGDLDLAAGNNPGAPNHVYENTGAADPAERLQLAWTSAEHESTTDLAWGDWDRDGDPDLVVAAMSPGLNRLYRNTGGDLELAWSAPEPASSRRSRWGDLNGDGLLDVAFAVMDEAAASPRVFLTTPEGSLEEAWLGPELPAHGLAWADADLDGDLDLATAHRDDQPEQLWGNEAGLLEWSWQSTEGQDTEQVAWGDVDGDGVPELYAANFFGQPNRLHASEPTGLEQSVVFELLGGETAAWGDADGDGVLDLAVAGYSGLELALLSGSLEGGNFFSLDSRDALDVAWGDADGDGDLDLAVAYEDAADGVWESGVLGGPLEMALTWQGGDPTATSRGVEWVDWNGDGALDLLVAGDAPRLYLNTGSADPEDRFEELPWPGGPSNDVRCGDLDGDGDPDAVVAAAAGDLVVENTPAGPVVAWEGWGYGSLRVDLGDLDGDGDLDLAFAGGAGIRTHLVEDGVVDPEPSWSVSLFEEYAVAWGDMDGDGDLDLATGGYTTRLWSNRGGELHLAQEDGQVATGLAWADGDGDGDIDLATVYGGETRLLENHRLGAAHLPETPTRPVLGYPVDAVRMAAAGTFTPSGLSGASALVPFVLVDAESDPAPSVRLEYSVRGPGSWIEAEVVGPTTDLEASPEGTPHELEWLLPPDLASDDLALRLVVEWQSPRFVTFPIQRGAIADISAPIRVYTPCWPRDGDGDGSPCDEDCDDGEPEVAPGVAEVCGDGVDNDCDGEDVACPPAGCSGCRTGASGTGPSLLLLLIGLLGLRRGTGA